MILVVANKQIGVSVVQFVAIDMMNALIARKASTQCKFSLIALRPNVASIPNSARVRETFFWTQPHPFISSNIANPATPIGIAVMEM